MAEQDLDRSEEATPYKLQKARDRAQTPRSVDAVAAAVFLAATLFLAWQGVEFLQELLRLFHAGLVEAAHGRFSEAQAGWVALHLLTGAAGLLAPLWLALAAAAMVSSITQTGMVFSLDPLKIDFQRINPATGFKRVFSLRTLFDGARACAKLLVLGAAGAAALHALLPQFHVLSALPPAAFLRVALEDASGLAWKMTVALMAIAVADLLFTRREFGKRMRMSRRELKDEFKNREGDPRIRARLRELRREMLRRCRALRNTSTADVVLTNPTHYAVALRYVHGEMDAPRVVAKGAGLLAATMRQIAARHRIVVVQNPPLARRLFREVGIDAYLPPEFHAEVARIIVWVLAMRQQRAHAGAAA